MRQKGKKCAFCCTTYIYGDCKRIRIKILPHSNVLMFEIGALEATNFFLSSNLDPITNFFQ